MSSDPRPLTVEVATDPATVEDMNRRQALGTLATASLATTPLGSPAAPTGRAARLGSADAARIQQAATRLYRLDYQHGGTNLWQAAIMEARGGLAMLERGTYSEKVGKLILCATSRMRMCAGWLAFDAGRADIARSCYNEALSLARQANDAEVECHALANLAFQSNTLGRPREALRFADAAERCARNPGIPARMAVIPHLRRATAHTLLGDSRACDDAIKGARLMLDRDGVEPTTEWLAFLTPAELDGVEATCAAGLGSHHRSERLLERAIAGHNGRYSRNRALYEVRLAGVRMSLGAVDGAALAANAALDDLRDEVVSWRVNVEFVSVIDRLARHPEVDGVDSVLARQRLRAH